MPLRAQLPALDHSPTSPRHRVRGADRRRQAPAGWRGGEGSSLRPSPSVRTPPLRPAGWWQKSIAALTLLLLYSLPPSSRLQDLALRVGRAGQLEVSSLRHSRACLCSGLVLWLSLSAFVSNLSLSCWGPNLMFSSSLAPLFESLWSFILLSFLGGYRPLDHQVPGHAELRTRGRDMSLNRCCRQNTGLSATETEGGGYTRGTSTRGNSVLKS